MTRTYLKPMLIVVVALAIACIISVAHDSPPQNAPPLPVRAPQISDLGSPVWSFVSIPDFVNFDIDYPQTGWEDGLDELFGYMQENDPDLALVAGDLVMGRWGTSPDEINTLADRYYPQWLSRFKAHNLPVYTAIGDHEIGDNNWPVEKAPSVATYKDAFTRNMQMPQNGPEGYVGTSYYFTHREVLFIVLDMFELGDGPTGKIVVDVGDAQLLWLDRVLSGRTEKLVVVMGHAPILTPFRWYSSSHLHLVGGRQSKLWQTMVMHKVDAYLCGEVHNVTCTYADGIQQVAHGGLIGRTTRASYLEVGVYEDKLTYTLYEVGIENGEGTLPQHNKVNGPWDTINVTGRKVIGFTDSNRSVVSGICDEKANPVKPRYRNKLATEGERR